MTAKEEDDEGNRIEPDRLKKRIPVPRRGNARCVLFLCFQSLMVHH